MNRIPALLLLVASSAAAQTTAAPKPATTAAKPAVHQSTGTTASAVKLPPGVPPVKGLMHTGFALRYQEIKIGSGAVAEPNKLYKVAYTGWLASDGKKFDSSLDHPGAEPIQFPQGRGRVIPGWDQGFEGMKIGGKRRLFIPYQLAYGAMGRAPVIPAKANLIFDIELVGVSEIPAPGTPGGPGSMMGRPRPTAPPPSKPDQTPNPTPNSTPSPAPATTPAPGSTTAPPPAQPPASQKPTDPTAPTTAPNSAPPPSSSPNATPTPGTPPPAAAPDKPANPAQPNPTN